MKVTIDNTDLSHLNNMSNKVHKALQKAILVVEAQAKSNLYAQGDDGDHGELARSIYSEVIDTDAYVATPLEAGFWREYGTGTFAVHGDGRPGWWVYIDDDYPHPKQRIRTIYTEDEAKQVAAWLIASGVPAQYVHVTQGDEARPFLKPALHQSVDDFKSVLIKSLKDEIIHGK